MVIFALSGIAFMTYAIGVKIFIELIKGYPRAGKSSYQEELPRYLQPGDFHLYCETCECKAGQLHAVCTSCRNKIKSNPSN